MSFYGSTDPAYIAWAADKGKLGKRVPSWKQANAILTLAAENRERIAKKKEKERKEKKKEKKEKKEEANKNKFTVTESEDTVYITVPRNADPYEAVAIIMKNYKGGKSFIYYRWDKKDGIIERSGITIPFSEDAIKDVVFGGFYTQKVYEGNDGEVIALSKVIGKATNFSLRDHVSSNCVLEAIRKHCGRSVEKKLTEIRDLYSLETCGVTKEIMSVIARKLRLRLVVYTCIDSCWFDSDPLGTKKWKKLEFFARQGHAEKYKTVGTLEESSVCYVDDFTSVENIHARKLYFCKLCPSGEHAIGSVMPDAIWCENTIYKTFVPSSVSFCAEDDLSKDYFLCTGRDQFLYKKWVIKNRLRPLSGVYFSIFKNANLYLGSRIFSAEKSSHLYDMNRAYPSFRTNPLYEKFRLIVGNVCLYDVRGIDVSEVVSVAGVSLIENLVWHNKFVESCGWIDVGVWCNHIILYTILEMGWATFSLSASCICRKTEDLDFCFGEDKHYNNAFIGRLIAGARENSSGCRVEYTRVYSSDIDQVMYDLSKNPMVLGSVVYPGCSDSKYVAATIKVEEKKKQLYQIHGCILAYQQVTMMKAMVLASEESFVVGYNTDGFHSRGKISLPLGVNGGEWKYEQKEINYMGGNIVCEKWDGKIELDTLPRYVVEGAVSLITGPAGCGKSYDRIEVRHGGAVICCPTNELVMNTTAKTTCPVMTYHKYFGIGCKLYSVAIDEVVVIDEVSMITGCDLLEMITECSKRRVCLDLIGDVRIINGEWDTDQMGSVNLGREKDVSWHDAITSCSFTHREVIGTVRRQSEEDCVFIDSLRGLASAQIRKRLIERFGLKDWEDVNRVGLGISARHASINRYNNEIVEKWNPRLVIGRCLKNVVKKGVLVEAKGQIKEVDPSLVWKDRQGCCDTVPAGYKYELAYFRTTHAVQGQSIGEPYIIDLTGNARYLYTAVSRCRSLDLITLVDSTNDFYSEEFDEFEE